MINVISRITPVGKTDTMKGSSIIYEGKFEDSMEGIYYYKSNSEKVLLTNFTFTFTNEIEHIYSDGNSQIVLRVQIRFFNSYLGKNDIYFLDINKIEIQSLITIMIRNYPFLCVYNSTGRVNNLMNEYTSMIYIRSMARHNFYSQIYMYPGWQNVNGTYRYLSNEKNYCMCNRELAPMNSDYMEVLRIGEIILSLGNPEVIIPLFLQMHIGVLYHLFALAGCNVQHILTLTGETGSRKSSVAAELFCNFDIQNIAGLETSTSSGLEGKAEACKDLTLVIDDMWKANSDNQKSKLDFFMRQYCDASERVKRDMNNSNSIISSTLRCGAVLTAESIPDDYQKSSLLRLLVVPINRDDINNEILAQLQLSRSNSQVSNSFSLVEIYLSYFINFVESNYSNIIEFIRTYIITDYHPGEYRLAQTYKVMMITYDIISKFYNQYMPFPMDRDYVVMLMQNLMKYNYNLANRVPIYEIMLQAISSGIQNGALNVAGSRAEFINYYPQYIGFYEDSYMFIEPDIAYKYASDNIMGKSMPNKIEFLSMLRANNISSGYETEGHAPRLLKKIKVQGGYIDILVLKKEFVAYM